MSDKKRKYQSEIVSGKPLKLQSRPRPEDEDGGSGHASPSAKLIVPESRDLVLRLIDKIKQR